MSPISTALAVALAAATGATLMSMAACSLGRAGSAPPVAADASNSPSDAGEAASEAGGDAGSIVTMLDGSPRPDADVDTDASDSGPTPCSGVICNGQCVATDDCTACSGAPLLCTANHSCVSACAGCTGQQIECFSCDAQHANPIGTCEPANASTYCLNGNYFGSYRGVAGYHCGCADGGSASCPGNSQTCVMIGSSASCVTCGEPIPSSSTAAATCKQGGSCNSGSLACE